MYNLNLLNLAGVTDPETPPVALPPMEVQAIEEPDYGPVEQTVTEMHAAGQTLDNSEEASDVLLSVASALEPTIQESQPGVTDVHAMEALMLAVAPLRIMAGAKARSSRLAIENFGDRSLSYRETNLAIEDLKSVAMAAKDKIVEGIQWLIEKFKEFIKFITDADHRQMEKAKKLLEQAKTHAEMKGGLEVSFFDGLNFLQLGMSQEPLKPGSAGKLISTWAANFSLIENLVDTKDMIDRMKKIESLKGDEVQDSAYDLVRQCVSFNIEGLKHIERAPGVPEGYTMFVAPMIMGKRLAAVVPSNAEGEEFWNGISHAGIYPVIMSGDAAIVRDAMKNSEGFLSLDNSECVSLTQAAIMHITARLNTRKAYDELVRGVEEMKNHILSLQKKPTTEEESKDNNKAKSIVGRVGKALSKTALSGMSTIQSLSAKQCAVVLKVVAASLHANGQKDDGERQQNSKNVTPPPAGGQSVPLLN